MCQIARVDNLSAVLNNGRFVVPHGDHKFNASRAIRAPGHVGYNQESFIELFEAGLQRRLEESERHLGRLFKDELEVAVKEVILLAFDKSGHQLLSFIGAASSGQSVVVDPVDDLLGTANHNFAEHNVVLRGLTSSLFPLGQD